MATIADYYKYAVLATAGYVRMAGNPLDGAVFASQASNPNQAGGRLPLSLATELFNPADPDAMRWTVAYYYGGDRPDVNDKSGLAATLFKNGEENVLAIRGVEVSLFSEGGDIYHDLLGASIGGIGMIGTAVTQLVDLLNLIERLYTPTNQRAMQIKAELSTTRPEDKVGQAFIELKGELGISPISIPVPLYLVLNTYERDGLGVLGAADKITLTGHSLGGHLAAAASMIFPDRVNDEVFAYNAAGFDPATWSVADLPLPKSLSVLKLVLSAGGIVAKSALADSLGSAARLLDIGAQQKSGSIINALQAFFGAPVGAVNPVVRNLESEDSLIGDDTSLVSSMFSGSVGLGAEISVPTEVNSHSIEQIMDALALHAVLYRLDNDLTLATIKKYVDAAEKNPGISEEILVEALHGLLIPDSRLAPDGLQLPTSDASVGIDFWNGKGAIAARDAYYTAILEINKQLDQLDLQSTHVVSMMDDGSGPLTKQKLIDRATFGPDEYAYRYALEKLLPFAVTGIDYQTLHNSNDELELYDREYHTGSLTTQWVADRAEFMYWKNIAFRGDNELVSAPGNEDQLFVDVAAPARIFTTDVDGNGEAPTNPLHPRRIVFGGDHSDALAGGELDDRLYGGAGTDLLQGARGNDYLDGGAGLDLYQYGAIRTTSGDQGQTTSGNDGADTIVDTDGRGILRYFVDDRADPQQGRVIADARTRVSDTQWQSTDGRFVYTKIPNDIGQYDLQIAVSDGPGGSLVLKDWQDGDFGIRPGSERPAPSAPTPADPPINGDKHVPILTATVSANAQGELIGVPQAWFIVGKSYNVDQDEQIISATVTFYVLDALGNAVGTEPEPDRADKLYGSEDSDLIQSLGGNDEVYAKGGNDLVFGGSGNDSLYGDAGSDKIFGEAGQDHLWGGLNDDDLYGGDDADILNGMDGKDRLAGGKGKDLLFGDGGNDELYVDDMVEASDLAANVRNAETQSASGLKGEWLDGGEGDDIALGGADNDQLMGGGGDDVLIGGGGNDNLDGDLYAILVDRDQWLVTREIEPAGTFTLYRERFDENIQYGISQNGGNDILYGGAGSDWLFGWGGNDLLDGGNDDDVAFGGTGDDVLLGGAGSDVLAGDNGENSENPGADYLEGGDGADFLWGNGGDDILLGGNGNDELHGGAGDDMLIGGGGDDTLEGGAGKDTYVFNKGDGKKVVYDTSPEDPENLSERSILILGEGFKREDIAFRLGSLMIDLSGGDEIHFAGFNPDDPISTAVLGEIRFFDGTVMTYQDVLDQGFDVDGTEGDDNGQQGSAPMLIGTAVGDRIHGFAGNDVLAGLAGDDTLDGGAGADFLQGGAGDDRYVADLTDTIDDIDGHNSIALSSDVTPGELAAQQVTIQGRRFMVLSRVGAAETAPGLPEGLRITGDVVQQNFDFVFAGGITLSQQEFYNSALKDSVVIEGGNGDDALAGYGGDDTVRGRSGDDSIIGARGNDLLTGDDGSDIYIFTAGDGRDVIDERGLVATGYADAGSIDVIRFAEGIATRQVVLRRQASGDLIVRYGQDGQITVKGQYSILGNAIERIEFADGTMIDSTQLVAVQVAPIEGTDSADILIGTTADDTMLGLAGDDVIDGGAGNDHLEGGAGADTYRLYAGMGMDTVIDPSETLADVSTLKLVPGSSLAGIKTQRVGNDLSIVLRGRTDGILIKNYYDTTVPGQHWQVRTADEAGTDIADLISLPDPFDGDLEIAAREAYKQNLLAAWSDLSTDSLPTYADVFSSWTQTTVTTYGVDPNEPPQIELLPPVTYKNINGYGVGRGDGIAALYPTARTVQTQFLSRQSDDAVIGVMGSASESASQESHTVTLLGTPQTNRSVSTTTFQTGATSKNTVVSSTAAGWVPIALDRPGSADGSFQLTRFTENRVIEQIDAGNSNNVIEGVLAGNRSHIALIDAGGGDDFISVGAFDFVLGGEGNDSISGGHIVYGDNGDDLLFGDYVGAAGNYLYGAAGNDRLYGGNSVLAGGEGDDYLAGNAGATVFVIDPQESGKDFIADTGSVSQSRIDNWYYQSLGVAWPDENLQFGGMWSVIGDTGFALNQFYRRPNQYDQLLGQYDRYYRDGNGYPFDARSIVYAGLDDLRVEFTALGITYKAEDIRYIAPLPDIPHVVANDYAALQPLYDAGIIEQDVVEFGPGIGVGNITVLREQVADDSRVKDSALILSWNGGHALRVALAQSGDPAGTGIERYRFADGTSISTKDFLSLATPVVLHQGPNDFTFLLGSGVQALDSHYSRIFFDPTIAPGDISISRSATDLVISRNESGDRLIIPNWYSDPNAIPRVSAQFYSDDSTLPPEDLTNAGLVVHGTASDDALDGLNGFPNNLYGEGGSDFLVGADGNDILHGGAGNDTLIGGDGDDILYGDEDNPAIFALSNAASGEGTAATIAGASIDSFDAVEIARTANEVYPGNDDLLDGGAGNDNLQGGLGNDRLFGGEGDDFLDGGTGDDVLVGGAGDDIYNLYYGSGHDAIVADCGGYDSIHVLDALTGADVALTRIGDDLAVALSASGDDMRLSGWYVASDRVRQIVFGDGTALDEAAIIDRTRVGTLTAVDDYTQLLEDGPAQMVAGNVLDNDAYSAGNAAITVSSAGAIIGTYGFLNLARDGSYTYTLDEGAVQFLGEGESVSESFGYSIDSNSVGTGASVDAVLTILIYGQNDAPVVAGDSAEVQEDGAFMAGGNVLENDNDADRFTALAIAGPGVVTGAYGALLLSADGEYEYVLNNSSQVVQSLGEGKTAVEIFEYYATDGIETAAGVLAITVTGANDAPVVVDEIEDQNVSVGSDFRLTIAEGSFTDIDSGDILSYATALASGGPLPSWLAFDHATRTFSGIPAAADAGTLQVRVDAIDLAGVSTSDVFRLVVAPVIGKTIIGTKSGDTLLGTDYDDVIDGRAGADMMAGKRGDDTYYVDNFRDVVTELAGQGGDSIFSSVTYTLPENVENITLIGTENIRATGNALDNILSGNKAANTLIGGAGNDTLDGKGGADSMIGGTGNDSYIVDNASDSVTEYSNQGTDTVQSAISYALGANIENLTLVGTAAIDGTGNAAANLLVGNAAVNKLSGKSGNDILQGLGGSDVMSANGGHTLFDGGAGADAITGGTGNEMFIGGLGNDTISVGSGSDIIAFNAGDGQDLINASSGKDNVLSIGGGIRYPDLKLKKAGNNLILKTGGTDQITFKDWYSHGTNHSVATLQIFTERMSGYDRNSGIPLLDHKVEQFDFATLVHAFDSAGQLNGWALTNALLSAHLSGSDTAAIGGDLAYQYGKNGTLSGIGLTPAQDVLNASQFGSGGQTLRPIQDLQQGQIRLS